MGGSHQEVERSFERDVQEAFLTDGELLIKPLQQQAVHIAGRLVLLPVA